MRVETLVPPVAENSIGVSEYVHPETAPIPPISIPETVARESEPGRLRRLLVRGGAVLALAGAALSACTTGDKPAPTPSASAPAGPIMEDKVGRQVALSQFSDEVRSHSYDADKARAFIPKAAAGNPAIQGPMEQVLTNKAAVKILDEAKASSNDKKPFDPTETPQDSLTDTKIKANVATHVYTFGASKVVDVVSQGNEEYPLDVARKEVRDNMPAGAEAQRNNALKAIDQEYATDAVSAVTDENEIEVRTKLTAIDNPAVRAQAVRVVDLEDAADVLNTLSFDGITKREARADLSNIANDSIRKKALAALNGDYETLSDTSYDLSDKARQAATDLEDLGKPQETDVVEADAYRESLQQSIAASGRKLSLEMGGEFATSSGLTPDKAPMVKPLKNPDEIVDLSGVQPKETIINAYKLTAPEAERHKQPETYPRFGGISVKDGKVAFELQEGLDPKLVRQLQEAYDQVAPLMEAGFASGEITNIHLITGDAFNPAYAPTTREVYMTLGSDKSMTIDRLVSAWRHELLHGISRNILRENPPSPAEVRRFAAACNNLKATAYDDLERDLTYGEDKNLIARMRAAALPKHRPIIDALATAVKKGTLTETLKAPSYKLEYDNMLSNECEGVDSAVLLIDRLEQKAGVVTERKDMEYFYKSEAFVAFAKVWQSNIEYTSVFAKINESAYITNADYEATSMGHSEDDAAEMYASILDAALTWPDKFQENLKQMEKEDRKAVIDMLGLCTNYMGQHESLMPLVIKLRTQYALAA